MVYRDFGNTGVRLSPLGFGMMRLPAEEEQSIEMVRYAIDNGVNYIDTAYNYLDGNSEIITGRALADGYRDMIYLATKMPVWMIEKESDFDRILNEQLTKLNTDQIDFYLLHALNKDSWKKVIEFDLIGKMKKARDSGKICFPSTIRLIFSKKSSMRVTNGIFARSSSIIWMFSIRQGWKD